MLTVAGAVLGAIFGSFIATIVIRWPQGRSVAHGRSACDGCAVVLPPGRLVPLVSYAWQRGRAACCGARIDPLHPLTEAIAAAIGGLSVLVAPDLPGAVAGALFGWLLLALALLDVRHYWLPNALTAALALTGLAAGLIAVPPPLVDRLIGGAAGFAAFAAVRHGYRLLRGREGMGGGDVKLFGAIGLWLGWRLLPIVLLAAALAGLLWSLVILARGKPVSGTTRLPFGLLLALAAWAVWAAIQSGWLTA